MLQEVLDLQQGAVNALFTVLKSEKREITFRAPTGSGKTRMMADLMNKVLAEKNDVIFLVSTLSKGGLAEQNFHSFEENVAKGIFPHIKPYLINSDTSGEEGLFIPLDYNVYVLPRDLYKEGGKLMQGGMQIFLNNITNDLFGIGKNKRIYLIKDECHVATNNLDNISEDYFSKVLNFSATPNLKRGQEPDVQITDEEAVRAKLIKRVEFGNEDDGLDVAIDKYLQIKKDYISKLKVSPCLIIQISNKNKADKELEEKIMPALNKYQELKWMIIANPSNKNGNGKNLNDTNDDVKKKLPVDRWKDYAKTAAIDVIIFKMVISEGWDIPRACMLYQVRDTKSKQLDEQVLGRVRRNPRLVDFETLDNDAQELATTAWVWGIKPDSMQKVYEVKLYQVLGNIQNEIKVNPIRLAELSERKTFDVEKLLDEQKENLTHESIFDLYMKLQKCPVDLQNLCFQYVGDNFQKWIKFTENIDSIKKKYNTYICDYAESMEVCNPTSFPSTSFYGDTQNHDDYDDWVWSKEGGSQFAFDSEAERLWAKELNRISYKYGDSLDNGHSERFLWGKNFPANSEIKFQYYSDGVHTSYPDFVLKDRKGIIHIFEVKSLNESNVIHINEDEYKEKIEKLKECYRACSEKLENHYFYIPIRVGEQWKISRFVMGNEESMNLDTFKQSFKK